MTRSMTAFARCERQGQWGTLTWELRSLNHRYLEVFVRMPETLRGLENAVREHVGRALGRGKVECVLRLHEAGSSSPNVSMDMELAKRLVAMAREIDGLHDHSAPLEAMDVLRWPGVVQQAEIDVGAVGEAALELLGETLEQLVAAREREGSKLSELIVQRCDKLDAVAKRVRERVPEIRNALRQRLDERLAELDVEVDPARLEQELVLQLQKMDVDEELDRLASHLQEVRSVLKREEPVGRRLDFLMQELNREANTLGSKSAAVETSRASVDLKVLIEQMREQVQNIE